MKKRVNKIVVLVISLIIAFAPGIFGSLFTVDTVSSEWYLNNKPSFTPPSWVFGPVWTILYFLIALSLFFSWTNAKTTNTKKKIALLFGINLLANGLWSYLFFGLQTPLLAFFDLLVMLGTIAYIMVYAWKIDRKASWLLLPYLLWVLFAGVLNLAFVV